MARRTANTFSVGPSIPATLLTLILATAGPAVTQGDEGHGLQVGLAEVDITPPVGFPMAGYYHERLAEGSIDPLKAKAIVFRDGDQGGAIVVCDLIGIATDLSREVRRRASAQSGIPEQNIVLAATHSHTAPDYMKELWLFLGQAEQEPLRAEYIAKLIEGPVSAIVVANGRARPSTVLTGSAVQEEQVSFNRRFVMRDGTVRTWQSFNNPEVVRSAGPIDPEIGLVLIRDLDKGAIRGVFSSFALHLDTVGGTRWSADYPFFIEQVVREATDSDVVSIFGTGCCGDINHANPRSSTRNKADFIGTSLGKTIAGALAELKTIEHPRLKVQSRTIELPLQDATAEEIDRAIQVLESTRNGTRVDFFDHVTAYKKLILDQLRHKSPHVPTDQHITWGLSRSLAGIGERLPVEVTVFSLGNDLAIVCLPGEVFVDLGLAIKQASPFRTTLVVELCGAVETIYVPHRQAYIGGSYEVTNSNLQPGGGELLIDAAIEMLQLGAQGLQSR